MTMWRRLNGLVVAALTALALTGAAEAKSSTIALIPGLTTDAFYITMHKGAEVAAKAVGATCCSRAAPEFNPVQQVPVLQAVIARHPDAILIAPTDKTAAHRALEAGGRRRHPGHHRRYLHRRRQVPGRRRARATSRSPTSPPTTCWAATSPPSRWPSDRRAGKVYVSNVKPGISTTDQREEGFKLAMSRIPQHHGPDTQFNDDDANKAASQVQAVLARNPDLAGVFGANLFSALGAANGVKAARQARARSGSSPSTRRQRSSTTSSPA